MYNLMPMLFCPICDRDVPLERNGNCASCNSMARRAEATAKKAETKRNSLIAKAKVQKPRAKINKVSDKMKLNNKEYGTISSRYKEENPLCLPRINGYCTGKTESVHHKRGRGRYLTDVSTFLPCCLSCHSYIEAHPEEAKERGWSESRLAINQERTDKI